MFPPAPPAKSPLGIHRLLSTTAGVRVSPLCLGSMNLGEAWEPFLGKCDKDQSFALLDYFFEQGGNFIDTANNYQNEETEQWLGEWMKSRGNRDQIVLATKYSAPFKNHDFKNIPIQTNYQGNHTKSLKHSIEASLKKLQTDYIDLFYVHFWDFTTSIPELMQSLNNYVQQGKILYLGISDTPAWLVSKANEYARNHGLRGFSVYQGMWNCAHRDLERDIIPMCRDEGMAIAPWKSLGGGGFKTKEQREKSDGRNYPSDDELKVSDVLEKIANAKNTAMTSVALAYVMAKTPYVFPIVGGRKIEHLKGNIEALKLRLSSQDIADIEAATSFDIGWPLNFLFTTPYKVDTKANESFLVQAAGHLDIVDAPKAIEPRE